jgi:dsDNA-binding SOS-regulon protein
MPERDRSARLISASGQRKGNAVSIESMNEDLARLKRDVRSLSQDAGRMFDDVVDQSRTIREETVAAEFIAAEETMENVGSVLDALMALREIQREQLRVFVADQRETFGAITRVRSPIDLARVGFEHWSRRATHVAEGLNQTVEVLANESRSLTRTLVEVWTPFLALMRSDWVRR